MTKRSPDAHARGQFNLRFAQPSSMSAWDGMGAFPHADAVQTEPVTGQSDGLLARQEARGAVPRIFSVNSGVEYWRGGAALIHTDPTGTRDLALPPNVRAYFMAGTQHGAGTLPLTDRNPVMALTTSKSRPRLLERGKGAR